MVPYLHASPVHQSDAYSYFTEEGSSNRYDWARVGGKGRRQQVASRDIPELMNTLEPLVPPDSSP
jgi:hypothetical protein